MLALMFAVVLAEPLARVASDPVSADPSAVAADSSAVAAARAARARVKTRPESVPPPEADRKRIDAELERRVAAARALGHHGQVVVEGIIGIDGRFTDLRVRTSSRADDLDALALDSARATIFKPARDAAGVPLAIWGAMPFEVMPASFGMGTIAGYRCDAFVRDMDWWQGAWPEAKLRDSRLYLMVSGFELVRAIGASGVDGGMAKLKASTFDDRWVQGLATCRSQPSMKFLDAIKFGSR